MATETLPRAASPDSPPPAPSRRQSLGGLSVDVIDAIDDIRHVFDAYRCIEHLLMPARHEARPLEADDREFHTLVSVLNDALSERIQRAKRRACRMHKHARRPTI